MTELPEATRDAIAQLCIEGDGLVHSQEYDRALQVYWAAWALLPEPRLEHQAAIWLLAGIGDTCFLAGDFVNGREYFSQVMQCPGALGNPNIHLRLGQCCYELGDLGTAADELIIAYLGGGTIIFRGEAPRYLALVHQHFEEGSDTADRSSSSPEQDHLPTMFWTWWNVFFDLEEQRWRVSPSC